MSTADKRRAFRALHDSGCFVIPNPWNVGSARYLQGLGFKALATTSSGYAHSLGFADGDVTRDMVLAHCREIADAADVPVNADFENGYADDPDVAANVRLCVETGVAGLSIEDSTGDDANPLYDFDLAVERVRAAREAIDKAGGEVIFTARTEGFITKPAGSGRNDPPAESLRRCRRRLPLFPRHQDPRADRRNNQGGRAEADQFSHQRAVRLHGQRPRRHGRAPHQRRRHAGAGRHARLHQIGARDRQEGNFDSFAGVVSNAELNKFFRDDRKSRDRSGRGASETAAGRLAGRHEAGAAPGPVTLEGRYGRIEKLDAAHAPASGKPSRIRRSGPICRTVHLPIRGFFALGAVERAALADLTMPLSIREIAYTGTLSLMEIRPAMRVIEVGHILYAPALQRTPLGDRGAISAARYAFETLGYRRYEWKCDALNAASRRAALRFGFTYRGHLPPAHDHQGPQPRHRLVFHARQRMAGAQSQLRALAGAGEFLRDGKQKTSLGCYERRRRMSDSAPRPRPT